MTRTMRIWMAAALAVAALAVSAAPSTAAAPKPVRSGTITGWGGTGWAALLTGKARDCQGTESYVDANPECAAWLTSGCNPALAGREPAVTASIVDIRDLAGSTMRPFEWRATDRSPGFGIGGGVVVQLWRADCTEIGASKWRSVLWHGWTELAIPRSAAWMTVTTNDTFNVRWTLR